MIGRSSCLLVTAVMFLASACAFGQAEGGRIPSHFAVGPSSTGLAGPGVRVPAPPVTSHIVFSFPRFVRAAGTIFSGTFTKIERREARLGQAVETVAVTFRVENAIRGAMPGEELTITQWIGLWSSGQRYQVGERVLLFLYPKSKLGLTSCVGGPLGRFAVGRARDGIDAGGACGGFARRSRRGWEVARTIQRLRLGGKAGPRGGMTW